MFALRSSPGSAPIHEAGDIAFLVILFFILSTTMGLRLYTRIVILKKVGWEDWMACLAFLFYLGSMAMAPVAIQLGLFKPTSRIKPEDGIKLLQISVVNEVLYPVTMAFAKLSILLQMIRIFVPLHDTKSFYFMVAFTGVNMLWFVVIFFVSIFQCRPVAKLWNPRLHGSCIEYSLWILIAGVFNMLSDFVMLALPLLWISRLQMDLKRKLTAAAVFIVGALACAASVIRFYFSLDHLRSHSKPGPFSLITVATCTSGEVAAAIICANLPNLPAFIKHVKKMASRETAGVRGGAGSPVIEVYNIRTDREPSKQPEIARLPDLVFLHDEDAETRHDSHTSNISGYP